MSKDYNFDAFHEEAEEKMSERHADGEKSPIVEVHKVQLMSEAIELCEKLDSFKKYQWTFANGNNGYLIYAGVMT